MCFLWPCEIVFSAVFKIIQSRGEPIPAVSGSGGGSPLTAHRNKWNLASNIYTTLTLYRVYSYFKCSLVGDAICGCFKLIGVSLLEEKSLDANDHKFLLLLTVPSHLLYHLQHTVPTKVTPSFLWRRHTAVILPWLCASPWTLTEKYRMVVDALQQLFPQNTKNVPQGHSSMGAPLRLKQYCIFTGYSLKKKEQNCRMFFFSHCNFIKTSAKIFVKQLF